MLAASACQPRLARLGGKGAASVAAANQHLSQWPARSTHLRAVPPKLMEKSWSTSKRRSDQPDRSIHPSTHPRAGASDIIPDPGLPPTVAVTNQQAVTSQTHLRAVPLTSFQSPGTPGRHLWWPAGCRGVGLRGFGGMEIETARLIAAVCWKSTMPGDRGGEGTWHWAQAPKASDASPAWKCSNLPAWKKPASSSWRSVHSMPTVTKSTMSSPRADMAAGRGMEKGGRGARRRAKGVFQTCAVMHA